MIVKIQVSIATTETERQVLIYDEHHLIEYQAPLTPELASKMKERPKAFFRAYVDQEETLVIGDEVLWQTW